MTREHDRNARPGERGSALVGVLLVLMLMSALAAALGVSGRTETLVARNHESAAQARAAAEAGLNHALELVLEYIDDNGAGAMNDLLVGPDGVSGTGNADADNGSLDALGIPPDTPTAIAGVNNATYVASVMDDEAATDEDDDPLADANGMFVIRAIGYGPNNSSVTLEAIIGSTSMNTTAVITNGNLTISGNPTVTGSAGSVHTNTNLGISGSPTIAHDATATGTYSVSGKPQIGGTATGGADSIDIPAFQASDYRASADFVLTASGTVTTPGGTVLCTASKNKKACEGTYGWEFQSASDGWAMNNSGVDGIVYVEGRAKISGNSGSAANPVQISIIAEGSIEISGNPNFNPNPDTDVLFVTNGDLKISGNLNGKGLTNPVEGLMLVREQLEISGNPQLYGQILVADATNADNLAVDNRINGNPTITYNGTVGATAGEYDVVGWREVR